MKKNKKKKRTMVDLKAFEDIDLDGDWMIHDDLNSPPIDLTPCLTEEDIRIGDEVMRRLGYLD